ncbi:MAG: hypothetical protein ACXABO_08520 [Promethearchaeota archaeon]|jgi:hypothetical protein
MNLAIPQNNISELLLYFWKIIDLPYISLNEMLHRISYKLFLLTPEKATLFINNCLKSNHLIKDAKGNLILSDPMNHKLRTWQEKRKKEIIARRISTKKISLLKNELGSEKSSIFSTLIKSFVERETLNRAVGVSNSAFNIEQFDREIGVVKASVSGTNIDAYTIEIDTNKKILKHNCHDFETRRSKNKKFCKHLTKLFLLLKDKNKNHTEFFLKDLVENIDKWDFTF